MSNDTSAPNEINARFASIKLGQESIREELSKLHAHVTEGDAEALRYLNRQVYDLKKMLFFPDLIVDDAAFNGQFSKHLVWRELLPKLDGGFAIETGTYLGGTTNFLGRSFRRVVTLEIQPEFQEQARKEVGERPNVEFVLADSASYLENHVAGWVDAGDRPEFFYLDAHWEAECPLLSEVETISRLCPDAIVMIDDMEVPDDKGYGFDKYDTAVLDRNYLAPVVAEFGLACFVPRLPSAKDCMSRFMVAPRGTWFVAQTPASIDKLAGCPSLRRI